eukprot:1058902-Amphidinium_carterae.1
MPGSAYGCVFKIRCSKGLEVASRRTPWPLPGLAEDAPAFELARMNPDSSFEFQLRPVYDPDEEAGSPPSRLV